MLVRSILALVASELYRLGKDYRKVALMRDMDPGVQHYELALQKLLVVLGDVKSPAYSLEWVLSALFLLICYELKFGNSICHLELHIQGVNLYIESQLLVIMNGATASHTTDKSDFTPYCAELLLWME